MFESIPLKMYSIHVLNIRCMWRDVYNKDDEITFCHLCEDDVCVVDGPKAARIIEGRIF